MIQQEPLSFFPNTNWHSFFNLRVALSLAAPVAVELLLQSESFNLSSQVQYTTRPVINALALACIWIPIAMKNGTFQPSFNRPLPDIEDLTRRVKKLIKDMSPQSALTTIRELRTCLKKP